VTRRGQTNNSKLPRMQFADMYPQPAVFFQTYSTFFPSLQKQLGDTHTSSASKRGPLFPEITKFVNAAASTCNVVPGVTGLIRVCRWEAQAAILNNKLKTLDLSRKQPWNHPTAPTIPFSHQLELLYQHCAVRLLIITMTTAAAKSKRFLHYPEAKEGFVLVTCLLSSCLKRFGMEYADRKMGITDQMSLIRMTGRVIQQSGECIF
jgi:hypothetical protein